MKAKIEIQLANATINPEKAGGDDGETGSALRFDGDVLVDDLVGLFSSSEAFSSLAETLYGKGQDLVARDISEIKMDLNLEKVKAVLGGPVVEDERLSFSGCRLNSVALRPKHGRAVGVTLKLYVHPAEDQWNEIVKLVRRTVTLKLSGGSAIEAADPKQRGLALETAAAPAAEPADAAGGVH